MKPSGRWPRRATVGLLAAALANGCGRLGYDPLSPVDAGQPGSGGTTSLGGRGGAAGAGGVAGRGGAGGVGGTAGGAGAASAGTGGAAGAGGGAGVGGSGGATGAGGAGGGPAIVCHPATHAGHAYEFCEPVVPWATARATCEGRGLRLVRVDDDAENAWLIMTATSAPLGFRRSNNLWLGGYEVTGDGDWQWTDGAAYWLGADSGHGGVPVGGLYSNWDPTEPDNATGPESCAAIPLNGLTWIDDGCTNNQFFVCEAYP